MNAAAQDGALVAQSKLGTTNESARNLASDSSEFEGINEQARKIYTRTEFIQPFFSNPHGHAYA